MKGVSRLPVYGLTARGAAGALAVRATLHHLGGILVVPGQDQVLAMSK
jgi:hypothetical protein